MRLRAALVAVLMLGPSIVAATTKIEGEYQLMMELRKDAFNRPYRWDWNSNEYDTYNNAQLRIFSVPRTGVEAFMKAEAAYRPDNNNNPRPEFQYREAHLRFDRNFGAKREWDTYVFSRQKRFWVEPYQMQVWSDGSKSPGLGALMYNDNFGDWQGIRSEWKGPHEADALFVIGDHSPQWNTDYTLSSSPVPHAPLDSLQAAAAARTDDLYSLRLRRAFLKDDRLKLGLQYARYEGWFSRDSVARLSPIDSLGTPKVIGQGFYALDAHYRVFGSDVNLLWAQGYPMFHQGPGVNEALTIGGSKTSVHLPDRSAVEAELRSIRLGTPRFGYLNITPIWWSRGPLWSNPVGATENDRTGFSIQSYYLLPERAITLTHNYGWQSPNFNRRLGMRYSYDEMYVEFVNGFTGKMAYRRLDTYGFVRHGQFLFIERTPQLDLIFETQVESKLAWLRVQGKLGQIGQPSQKKQIFTVEQSINLSSKAKIYNRFAFGNDPDKLRKALFTQLQYRPTGSMEMYLQYGPDYIGSGGFPVDEGNLNGSGDQFDQIKLILKGTF